MITNTVCFPLCKNCVAWHFETLLIMAWHHAFPVIFKSHNSLLTNYLLLTLKWITAYTVPGWFLTSKQVTIKIQAFWHATLCHWAIALMFWRTKGPSSSEPSLLNCLTMKMNALQTLKTPELPAHSYSIKPQKTWILRNITVMISNDICYMEMNRSLSKETSSDSAWGTTHDVKCQV